VLSAQTNSSKLTFRQHFPCWLTYFTLHTSHFTLHTLHTSHCILHTLHTLHSTHVTLHTSHSTLHTPHFTLNTSHSPRTISTLGGVILLRNVPHRSAPLTFVYILARLRGSAACATRPRFRFAPVFSSRTPRGGPPRS